MFLDNGSFPQYGENTIITMQRAHTLEQLQIKDQKVSIHFSRADYNEEQPQSSTHSPISWVLPQLATDCRLT
jgi:hypothetical protein